MSASGSDEAARFIAELADFAFQRNILAQRARERPLTRVMAA